MPKDLVISKCQVRALFDDNGKRVDDAGPSIPIQVVAVMYVLYMDILMF